MMRLSTVSVSIQPETAHNDPSPFRDGTLHRNRCVLSWVPHPRPHTSIFPLSQPFCSVLFSFFGPVPAEAWGSRHALRISGFSGSTVSVCSNQAFGFDWNPATVRVSMDHDDGGGFARDTTTKQRARAAHTNGACCDPTNTWRCGRDGAKEELSEGVRSTREKKRWLTEKEDETETRRGLDRSRNNRCSVV